MRKIILICFIWLAGTLFVSAQNIEQANVSSEAVSNNEKSKSTLLADGIVEDLSIPDDSEGLYQR